MRFRAGSDRTVAATIVALLLSACATPQAALLDSFAAQLAAQPSATLALGQWCGRQGFADPPLVTAQPVIGASQAPPADARTLLGIAADEPLAYRRVRLWCGGRVLSEADNWYVPARLTPAMNAALAASDVPFGRVAAPLGFIRERLAETRGAAPGCPPGTVLSHRGVLRLPDGRGLALVGECYTAANLDREETKT